MPDLVLSDLCKKFRNTVAVDHINLRVKDRKFVTLLGPSGCGKTTTLRMIAGFIKPEAGEIRVGERVISSSLRGVHISPEKRNMALVFQSYALWPHMSVLSNVMFGLRARKMPASKAREKAMRTLNLVKLEHLADRYPHQLSGGQQQRVSFARAIATEPEVLLLDEPLSNLDAKLREDMRFELRELHNKLHVTTIYVTHDQAEAIILSDEICLMSSGRILQCCSPKEIYENPSCKAVADFIGVTNLLPARMGHDEGKNKVVRLRNGQVVQLAKAVDVTVDAPVIVSIRPENIKIFRERPDFPSNTMKGNIAAKAYVGNYIDYRVEVGGEVIRVQEYDTDVPYEEGDEVYLWINARKLTVMPDEIKADPREQRS